MKLLIVNQHVSNSPSKIRGGWGALIPPIKVIYSCITNAPALTGTPS